MATPTTASAAKSELYERMPRRFLEREQRPPAAEDIEADRLLDCTFSGSLRRAIPNPQGEARRNHAATPPRLPGVHIQVAVQWRKASAWG
ncbi:hypothetical protein ACFV4Q_34810 [Streptomyces nojiriensis]|uniref:hypothetical protein n=1 Tax=Streptomyces nojiriensis TaxID=66374 RepID=UPI00365B5E50